MAKGNMLLGYSRGSVGDLTFYRRNAQQITRARARQVKNPKTLAQQMQRAIMRTAVGAYQVLKEICDHSYEGIAYGAESYSYFLKRNLAMLRQLAAEDGENTKSFLPSGFNGLVAMPWVLSKGSLSWVGYNNFASGTFNLKAKVSSAAQIDAITYSQFAGALGVNVGDQLTFIWALKRQDIDESSALQINVARVILSPYTGDAAETMIFDNRGKVINSNSLNENANALTFNVDTGNLFVTIDGLSLQSGVIGGAIIVSRRAADGSWLRSPEVFYFDASQRNGGYTLRQASMVAANEIQTPSDWYLNNANEISTAD